MILIILLIYCAFNVNKEHLTEKEEKSYCKFSKDDCKKGWMTMNGWKATVPCQMHKNRDNVQNIFHEICQEKKCD